MIKLNKSFPVVDTALPVADIADHEPVLPADESVEQCLTVILNFERVSHLVEHIKIVEACNRAILHVVFH